MKKFFYVLCVWLISQTGMAGGFHYDVYVSTTFEIDDNQQLQSLQMSWLHDKTASKLLLQGSDLSTPEARQLTLQSIADAIIKDLQKVNYLTQLTSSTDHIQFDKVTDYQLRLTDKNMLQLNFSMPLEKPYAIQNQRLRLSLSDINGTAILQYLDSGDLRFDSLQAKCKAAIEDQEDVEHGEPVQLITIACN